MGDHAKQNNTPPAPAGEAHSVERRQAADPDRRAGRTVDLTEEDIAAIEPIQMTPGFEQLDAELEPEPASLVEDGARVCPRPRPAWPEDRGAPGRQKAFRDNLYDDS